MNVRLGQVQPLRGLAQDRLRFAHVRVHVVGGALRAAGQQRPGVHQHQRVVVDVDDPGVRRHPLGDLVRVVRRGQAGTDVEKLPHTGLAGQVTDDPPEEGAVGPGDVHDARVDRAELITGRAVDVVVVLAAKPVIPDPGRMRDRGIDSRSGGFTG
jgi:hypothetical protein